ncbi:MAG: heavy-metal-associated domain-containing protein [Vicingaceae bacterium]
MKKKIVQISAVVFLLMAGNQAISASNLNSMNDMEIVSDSTTESFKVYGNCGMCKRTIEASLKDQEGVYSADWDKDTKIMLVKYDQSLISLEDIKKKIAAVGYDTEENKASEESYKGLPNCCQYERPEKK